MPGLTADCLKTLLDILCDSTQMSHPLTDLILLCDLKVRHTHFLCRHTLTDSQTFRLNRNCPHTTPSALTLLNCCELPMSQLFVWAGFFPPPKTFSSLFDPQSSTQKTLNRLPIFCLEIAASQKPPKVSPEYIFSIPLL